MMRFFPSLFIYFLFLFSLSPWDILCNILPLCSPEPHFRPGFLVSKCIEKDMVVCPRAVSGQLVIEPIDNSLGILSTNSKPSGSSPQTATIHSSQQIPVKSNFIVKFRNMDIFQIYSLNFQTIVVTFMKTKCIQQQHSICLNSLTSNNPYS